ncbi:Peptidyl-tRNA hydrolase 2, mitochondrial [Portunus trituberculatus]|uniref:peptidyl-tRNA hydrolase n=1 Tax=Portunus trituberculatus TaxID=210409 RepID=A0A5B7IGI6_PORTR|nr:Peptidyl-tRNA hydrolase 2, mitochondrial [Portunus trituberculatus]
MVQAILFIVVPILGPISPPKCIFGVTTQNLGIMCSHATLKAYKQLQKRNKNLLKAWEMNGQPKILEENNAALWFAHAYCF